ncbi:MAG: hypothetical protein ACMUIU_20010 [bacterium]
MHKQRSEYDFPIDTLVALAKCLSINEERYRMVSEEFFNKYSNGLLEDSVKFVEWANDYQYYMAIRIELERQFGMPHDFISKYFSDIEKAFRKLKEAYA